MRRTFLAAAILIAACGSRSHEPKTVPPPAQKAPDFTLTDSDGQAVTLSALLRQGPVILAFFPKAFTGG